MIHLTPALRRQRVPVIEHQRVALRAFTALAEMCNGTARRQEWLDLADSVNIVEALHELGSMDDKPVESSVALAIDGLQLAMKCPDGLMRMGHAQTYAMREIVSWHDDAIGRLSRGRLYEADELVVKRINDAQAGADTGVTVVRG